MKESFFQFSDPQLVDISFHINENFDQDLFEGFSIESHVHRSNLKNNKEALVNLELKIGDETEHYPFNITIVMSGHFICNKENFMDKLIETNAPALLLSYARPIVSLITSQAGYPAFNLPFMNFTEE